MKEFTVGKNDAGQRLDRFVGKTAPMLPASLLQKYIRQKDVKVNGRPAKGDVRLSEGDTVRLYIPDEFFDRPGKDDAWRAVATPKVDVVYEDENILLVNKRPGMLCHSAGEWTWDTLIAHIQAYLRAKGEWDPTAENSFAPALCNRIDRNTGGIVIAAKTAEALRIMDEKVRAREMEKTYLCAVLGTPKPSAGRLEGYLFKDAKKNQVYVREKPAPGAKTAVTDYRVLKTRGGLSLVECTLLTGRTHQIRAQFSSRGLPLWGDKKYSRWPDEGPIALWSHRLRFPHPVTGAAVEYTAPPPEAEPWTRFDKI
jgi:23S rRNA pseudouridine955/2504/2580 synthase